MLCNICKQPALMLHKTTGACLKCQPPSAVSAEIQKRTPRKPSKRSEYQRKYRLENRDRLIRKSADHNEKYKKYGYTPYPKVPHVIERGGLYKQWKNTKPQWGERITAQIYQTRFWAEQAVRIIGCGNVVTA